MRCGVGEQQAVTVAWRMGHVFRSQDAVGARPVVNHKTLLERLAHPIGQVARQDVGATARCGRRNQGDRTLGIRGCGQVLCAGDTCQPSDDANQQAR